MPNSGNDNHSALPTAVLGALGVVYGDIGTSPLYAFRDSFTPEHHVAATQANVLGVLSLILWALILVISIKYLVFVLRADNRGEGGILALMALVRGRERRVTRRTALAAALGLFGAALLFGDGIITPAISVLSAIEGLDVATPVFHPYVVPIALIILTALFLVQRHGTHRIGIVFGPLTLAWFALLGLLGVVGIARHPAVLAAVDPRLGFAFFVHNGWRALPVLGSLFLVVTGGEALYADMGHFGRLPIRTAWFSIVLPALLLNYFGQGALLTARPGVSHPFFSLAPAWGLYPLVFIATIATIIASQAIISGAFSLSRQAVQLGYLPRLRMIHTSAAEIGQIYVPTINWLLYFAVAGTVIGFRSSANLAEAYGMAISTTMLITTVLMSSVMIRRWRWHPALAVAWLLLFLFVDTAFFAANAIKIPSGGWFPLVVGALGFVVMSTWKRGRRLLQASLLARRLSLRVLMRDLAERPVPRVAGTAFYLTGNPTGTPTALLHALKHMKMLHERVVILTIINAEVPRIPDRRRVKLRSFGMGFYRVRVRYGFMESPDMPHILELLAERGLRAPLMESTFMLGREALLVARRRGMARWRKRLFARMSQNALNAAAYFKLPPGRVVEIGTQIEL